MLVINLLFLILYDIRIAPNSLILRGFSLAISLIAAIIGTIYNYVFMTFIEPDFVSQSIEIAREQMLSQNSDMTQEQMDMAMGITEKMMTPTIMAAMGIIFTLFFGFIVSLIAGLFMKENRPEH